jgi:hypothetical protein
MHYFAIKSLFLVAKFVYNTSEGLLCLYENILQLCLNIWDSLAATGEKLS